MERHILSIEKLYNFKLRFPFTVEATMAFIGYLLRVRKVSGKTVNTSLWTTDVTPYQGTFLPVATA